MHLAFNSKHSMHLSERLNESSHVPPLWCIATYGYLRALVNLHHDIMMGTSAFKIWRYADFQVLIAMFMEESSSSKRNPPAPLTAFFIRSKCIYLASLHFKFFTKSLMPKMECNCDWYRYCHKNPQYHSIIVVKCIIENMILNVYHLNIISGKCRCYKM